MSRPEAKHAAIEDARERCWSTIGVRELGNGWMGNRMGTYFPQCMVAPQLTVQRQLFQAFLVSTVLLGVLLVLLIYANIVLLIYHPPTTERYEVFRR